MPAPPTLVAFHAHPDDEAIFTGGLLVRVARAGWRTVVVLGTSGEAGSTPGYDLLEPGPHRRLEAEAACAELGVDRLVVLPFADSGLVARTGLRHTLAGAHGADVLHRLGEALAGEAPTVVTTYDERGVYDHPDHVAVHRAGRALARTGLSVYEATVDRRHLHALRDELVGRRALDEARWPAELNGRLGWHDAGGELLHLALDPGAEVPSKRAAIAADASQVTFAPEFMGIPPGAFDRLLAHEWYRPAGARHAAFEDLVTRSPAAVTA